MIGTDMMINPNPLSPFPYKDEKDGNAYDSVTGKKSTVMTQR
jgi:hypothetical protein